MSKVRGGGQEDLPHVQGKEQRLRFAGAAKKVTLIDQKVIKKNNVINVKHN